MTINKARCKHCGDVIESKHRHDFVACSCFAAYSNNGHHGIFIDGGPDYFRMGGNFDDFERIYDEPKKCNCGRDECYGSCVDCKCKDKDQ